MIMMSSLGFNSEFENAKEELDRLSTRYAGLLTDYDEMTGPIRVNLETQYMMQIGRKEHQLFKLQVQVLQLRREISLYQAAKNEGRRITPEEVKHVIDIEMAEYQAQLDEQLKKLKLADALHLSKKMSHEETIKLRKLYHDLARLLHPDINPSLPPKALLLWQRIVAAYKNWDWSELRLLADIAYDMLDRKEFRIDELDSMTLVRQQIDKLNAKIEELENKIAGLREKPPFTYEKLLEDAEAIAKRKQELDTLKHQTENYLDELEKIRDNLIQDNA